MSELKQTDPKLLLEAVWDSSADAMRISDSKGIVINVNNAYCKLTGFKKEELIGKKFNIIYNNRDSLRVQKEYKEYLSGNKKFERKEKKLTFLNEKQHVLEASYSQIEMLGDKYILCILRDITESKEVDEILSEREEQYRLLTESSPEMIFLIDREGYIKYANSVAAATFHLDAKEIIGKHLTEIYAPKTANSHLEKIKDIIVTKQKFYTEIEEEFPTGKIWIDVRLSPVINRSGKVVAVLGLSYNITERKQAELKIKEQSERINTMLKTMPDLMFVLDKEGFYKEFYAADISKLALPKEKIIGANVKDIFGVEEGEHYIQIFKQCIESGLLQVVEYQLIIDNQPMFFEARISRMDNEHVVSIIRDITDRKIADEAEKSHRKQLRVVLDTVPSYIFAKDYDGKFLMVNKSLADLFGVPPEEVVGKTDSDYGATKEQIEGYITADRKVIDSGEPLLIREEQVLRKDGSLGWFQTNKVPYQHPGTIKPAILGVAVDITERKQAEEKLRESENKYRILYQYAEVALFDNSLKHAKIMYCNQRFCDLFGFDSPEAAIGQEVLQLYVDPDDRKEVKKLMTEQGNLKNHTVHFKNIKTGRLFYGQLTMRIDVDGDTMVGTVIDITDQKRVEKEILNAKEKAEEMSRLKTNFLANMSHEIRTPMTGILGFASILEDELKETSYLEYTNAIKISGLRLLETLDLILSFSKLEAEKECTHYSNVCVDDVIEEVLLTFEALAKNKNLYLKPVIKDENLNTNTDERFLVQILNNLVNNAIKYTKEGGIIVELSKEEKVVVIKVKDTGIGIARDKFDVIFEEFRQESEGHGRSFEGTGLGLAITKRFVELMKGTIEVESKVGVGTTFIVKFPFEDASKSISIKLKNEEQLYIPEQPHRDKLSVLVVEDDRMNLLFTFKSIKEYYNVDTATKGHEALKKAKKKMYDIILMDINLGKGMNGIEAAREIRKLPGYKKTPVVALTAFVLPGDREEFIAGGCTHYLGKPFTKEQLLKLIIDIVDKE